ncbi:acetate/propionate family kinase [Shimia sp. MMG029]|uniref:acetate/propionate family kinase n=1 Tax=Shimia sp. MMG029 TaxID=3021978 RepID=UPI0022FF1F19|nr:acetate/propionate family kinase [Shimia sp. MMG029]MDA5555585.1 acetate/propionate family kinase [Shimia sp. MMG029]
MSAQDAYLILNAGSSSIKYAVYDTNLAVQLSGQVDRIGMGPHYHGGARDIDLPVAKDATHAEILDWLLAHIMGLERGFNIIGAGHRVVHGGQEFAAPARVTDEVIEKLRTLAPLAPGHQPHNLAGIEAVARRWPEIPQIACFDTAFHRTQPRIAQLFAIPRALSDDGVLRYGFHGLSYHYIATQLPHHLDTPNGKVIVAHLGNGASMCAMQNMKSVATTMGYTALDGLVMGRRCGELDPGVIFHMMRDRGMSVAEIETTLGTKSGLFGVSGLSSDMRDLLASDSPAAAEAVDLFVYQACKKIGALAATLGGLDAIVFTGGIGENAAPIRARILQGCAWLGADLDAEANTSGASRITSETSRLAAHVIPTDEEGIIAGETQRLVAN